MSDPLSPLCRLTGTVVHGRGRGRAVGMPTANLAPDPGTPLPPEGVYATVSEVAGRRVAGVTNVGRRPTVDSEADWTVETYLPGVEADLYGLPMTVTFYRFLRPVRKMDSLREVKDQVEADSRAALALLGEEAASAAGGG